MNPLRRSFAIDLALILASGLLVMLIQYQGWQGQELNKLDMLYYYRGATEFLRTGQLMDRGDLSSYSSWPPPGTFYFLIPGMIVFNDPRLYELIGNAAVYLGTLVFLYLAARELAGRAVALPAAIALAISRLGYQSLWPVGHPVYIVAMLFFLILWVKRRSAAALAVALGIGAIGLYADLAILPFFLVIPILWLIYRPPLGWRSLAAAVLFGAIVWFPYLRFESGRGFVDVFSLLLRRPVDVVWTGATAPPVYCYASQPGEPDVEDSVYLPYIGGAAIEAKVIYPEPGWINQAAYWGCRILMNVDRNFDNNLFLLGENFFLNAILWCLFLTGMTALMGVAFRGWKTGTGILARITPRTFWSALAFSIGGAIVLLLILNPWTMSLLAADRDLSRSASLAVGQLGAYLPWVWVALVIGLYLSGKIPERKPEYGILAVVLVVNWLLLVLLAEPGRPERFWYIWPLQILAMVMVLRWIAERLPRTRSIYAALILALGITLFPTGAYTGALSLWSSQGYAGTASDQWQVVDFLARRAEANSDRSLPIVYYLADSEEPANPNAPSIHQSDWFDYLLDVRYHVKTIESDPEGAGQREWAIVENGSDTPNFLSDLEPQATFGKYRIYQIP